MLVWECNKQEEYIPSREKTHRWLNFQNQQSILALCKNRPLETLGLFSHVNKKVYFKWIFELAFISNNKYFLSI